MVRFRLGALAIAATLATAGSAPAQEGLDEILAIPAIKLFAGGGLGSAAAEAPAELEQFGQLVGVWHVEPELRRQDGSWMTTAPGIWVWKYGLGGFAVEDLWYQSEENLPIYLAQLGRDYLLSGTRMYDAAAGHWNIAWAANSGGSSPGLDFGVLTGVWEDGRLVLSSPPDDQSPPQRIVFSDFTDESFVWTSSFSQDGGETWLDAMRVQAKRLR